MNYCSYYSIRFVSLLSFRSTNCRNLCTICKYKRNAIKYNYVFKSFETDLKTKGSGFSPLLSFKYNLKSFQTNNYFSTTFRRNQRLDQIHRNVNKEKTSKTGSNEPIDEWKLLSELSLYQKLKVMFRKYWYISIPVHCVTSGLWFGFLYLIAKSGLDIKPLLERIRPYIEKLPIPEFLKKPFMGETESSDTVGYVAVALILYKLLAPARYATTVFTSFYAIKHMVKRGLIKPVPSKEQIKAQVIKSRAQLNHVLNERLAKRDEMRRQLKSRKKPKT